ncbi:hypothetical protein RJT34_23916 [Clitoria ternatea]|uniref:Uncharacterized protein n=1 Tax=Clitoria ternatea TaxID=43366 RepID=A0AAN9FLZ6_CLITE
MSWIVLSSDALIFFPAYNYISLGFTIGAVVAILSGKDLVNVLADMELWGTGVDLERCIQAQKLLVKRLKLLEKEAYRLAVMKLEVPLEVTQLTLIIVLLMTHWHQLILAVL